MNEKPFSRLKKWGALAVIFAVIVGISVALPNYLTPPPAQPQQAAKKSSGTKTVAPATKIAHLAIVNEDQGTTVGGQRLNLGGQVVSLFSQGDAYQWVTVSRSVADSGLRQGDYQAAVFIPSGFTSNIFTYTRSKPQAAVITYQANPKLTAEDAVRIQTEMEKVKGTLNQQFSKIYWRVVSDQLTYIRNNFSEVLNKDKQYLQAMADFYKPSSQNMAQIFNNQLNQINGLLDETRQAAGTVNTQQQTLTNTKNQVTQQLDALNKLNEQLNQQMKQQTQTVQKTNDANKQLVADASAAAQNATTQAQDALTRLVSQYQQDMQSPLNQTVPIDTFSTSKEFNDLSTLYSQFSSKFTVDDQGLSSLFKDNQNYWANGLSLQSAYLKQAAYDAYNTEFLAVIKTIKDSVTTIGNGFLTSRASALATAKSDLDNSYSDPTNNGSVDGSDDGSNNGSGSQVTGTATGNQATESSTAGSEVSGSAGQSSSASNNGSSTPSSSSSISGTTGGSGSIPVNQQPDNAQLIKNIFTVQENISQELSDPHYTYPTDMIDSIQSNFVTLPENDPKWANYDQEKSLLFYGALRDTYAAIKDDQVIRDNINSLDQMKLDESAIDTDMSKNTDITNNQDSIDATAKSLSDSFASLSGNAGEVNKNVDQFKTNVMADTNSIQSKNDSTVQLFQSAMQQQKSDLQTLENQLASNVNAVQQQTASIVKPIQLIEPDISITDTTTSAGSGIAFTLNDNNFNQLNNINDALRNISDNESLILKGSKAVQSAVGGVQGDANQLTGSWGQNLSATAALGSTISQTLGNTGEPGNRNQNAYQQLASPVSLAGLQLGNPGSQTQNPSQSATSSDTTPADPVTQPFLTLLAVLIASILTGYFSYYYRNLSRMANAIISAALALITSGAIISYGVAQYGLQGGSVIMWSLFTIGLIAVLSAWVREAYQLSEIVGVLLISALVVSFTLPLLKNSLDRFVYQNPASDVYLAIAYGPDYGPFLKGIVAVLLLTVPVIAVMGIRALIRHHREVKADETETF